MLSKKVFATVIVFSVVMAFAAAPVLAQPIKWKVQAFWGASDVPYKTFVDFCNRVKVMTNGRLEITPYSGGQITPVFEMLDSVRANVLQGMSTCSVYHAGKLPEFGLFCDMS